MAKNTNNVELGEPSKIFLDECFESQSDQFVETLKRFHSPRLLVGFVQKWLADPRPWSRQQIVNYLDDNLNLPGHEVVVKRLFNHFRHADDHEMMGVLMVCFDRIVRRNRVKSYHFDWSTRRSWSTERLFAKPNKSVIEKRDRYEESKHLGRVYRYKIPDIINRPGNRVFSQATRSYLRRSAWRYFRYLSYREPESYVKAIARALARYRNEDFVAGENIIDNWSLMHACYFYDEVISFSSCHTNLVEGKSLEQLAPHPYQPEAWRTETARDALVELLVNANSTLIRVWAIELFLQEHKTDVGTIPLTSLVQMLASPDPNLQDFAYQIFDGHPALPTLTVDQWLELIDSSSENLLSLICDSLKKHVTQERLSTNQLLRLTCAKQVPVSELGFELLKSRNDRTSVSTDELLKLAHCQCSRSAESVALWAMDQICQRGDYHADRMVDFFDSLSRRTRNAAVTWLRSADSPGYNDALLWARLIETPFDDVKFQLIEMLNQRRSHPELESDQFSPVWVAVILGIHHGGRTKPKAIHQLTNRIIRQPADAENLLPVLAAAIRSVRSPELRNALSAVARLAKSSPELIPTINTIIPELEFDF